MSASGSDHRHRRPRLHVLAATGRTTRVTLRFLLAMVGSGYGVLREAIRPSSWRRTTRAEFRRTLNQAAGGGVPSTLFAAALIGLAVISQAFYWLGIAGLIRSSFSALVNVLLSELAPILVGIILLGRSGMRLISEIGLLSSAGYVRTMEAQGLDPFLLIVMPRALAFTISAFTLGIVFSVSALLVGFAVARGDGVLSLSIWSFLDDVAGTLHASDYVTVPLRLMLVGFLVGLSCCLTGLAAQHESEISDLLSRGFARGIVTVLAVNVLLSLLPVAS